LQVAPRPVFGLEGREVLGRQQVTIADLPGTHVHATPQALRRQVERVEATWATKQTIDLAFGEINK